MAKIYRRTDRIPIKIDDVTITIAPLSTDQKAEILNLAAQGQIKRDFKSLFMSSALAIKYAVKAVSGIEDADGKAFEPKFEGGNLTDESVDDLMNLKITPKLTQVCSSLTGSIPDEFTDEKGIRLEGVEFIKKEGASKN